MNPEANTAGESLFIQTPEIRPLIALGFVVLGLLLSSYIMGVRVERGDLSAPSKPAQSTFPTVALTGKAAYVYDLRTGEVLYAHNENTRLPLASLTKLMAALVASELTPLYSTIVVGSDALEAAGDSGLYVGERWSLKELLDFSLVTSSNDGMRAVALALGAIGRVDAPAGEITGDFVRSMNSKASELELKNTYFLNETGLDESKEKGGAYGSARDVALLMAHIVSTRPELLEATRESNSVISSLSNIAHTARNTNSIVHEVPGLIGSKTGYTNIAGGNLVIAFDPEIGRPIVISVLGSTEQGRFQDMRALVQATMQYLTQ